MIYTKTKYPTYQIGPHTYGDVVIHGKGVDEDGNNFVEIGDYCSLANGLQLQLGGNHSMSTVSTYPFTVINKTEKLPFSKEYGIYIGNDVWIGLDVVIRHGVTIGDGAVVGMGSLVLHDVPPYAVVVGNPAKIIRYRFEPEIIEKLLKIKWWEWSETQIAERLPEMDDPISFCEKYLPQN